MKKVFALLLSVAMVICMMPGMAFADETPVEQVTGLVVKVVDDEASYNEMLPESYREEGTNAWEYVSEKTLLPWLVIKYSRNTAAKVYYKVTKDGEAVTITGYENGPGNNVDPETSSPATVNPNAFQTWSLAKQLKVGDKYLTGADAASSLYGTYKVELYSDEALETKIAEATYTYEKGINNLKGYIVEANEISYNQLPESYRIPNWGWETVDPENNNLPWLVIQYSRDVAGSVYFKIEKDGNAVTIGPKYTDPDGTEKDSAVKSGEKPNPDAYATWSLKDELHLDGTEGNSPYGNYVVSIYDKDPTAVDAELLAQTGIISYSGKEAEVASGENTATVTGNVPEELQGTVDTFKDNLAAKNDVVATDEINAAALVVAKENKVEADTTGKTALENGGVTVNVGDTVTIVVQPYMDMKVTSVTADGTDSTKVGTFTVDITPMYRTVATTADLTNSDEIKTAEGAGKNAVVLGDPAPLEINETVEMQIPLPTGFANNGDDLYVLHNKKAQGVTYVYGGTVSAGVLTFNNPNGFSEFTITKTNPAKAKIDTTEYETLQAAINDVKDNQTITLLKDCDDEGTVTVSKAVKFTIAKGAYNMGEIVAASGYTLVKDDTTNEYTVTKNPSTGGGIYTPSAQKPEITTDKGATVALDSTGTKATITVADGYEIVDVTVNGVSKGAVKELTGLKAGDKVVVTTKAITSEPTKEEVKAQMKAVNADNFYARSKMVTMKNGKKAIKVTWNTTGTDVEFDGVEIYRSTKRYSGYGKKPIFRTTKNAYYNTSIKAGTKYYYKVRGYVEVEGEKIYTDYSSKAWRTVK